LTLKKPIEEKMERLWGDTPISQMDQHQAHHYGKIREQIMRKERRLKEAERRQVAGKVFVSAPLRIELQESILEKVRSADAPRSVPKTHVPQTFVESQ
jgi:hypothetical protein